MPKQMPKRKTCTKCGDTFSADRFTRSSKTKDGLYPQCRHCKNNATIESRNKEAARLELIMIAMLLYRNDRVYSGRIGGKTVVIRVDGGGW